MTVPREWVGTLKLVQTLFPEAVLAGGALRDLDNKKPVKDIDIFVTHSDNVENRLRVIFGDEEVRCELPETIASYVMENPPRDVRSIYHCGQTVSGVAIQVITLQLDKPFSLETVIERLDIGLCQIGTDGAYGTDHGNGDPTVSVSMTLDYLNDVSDKKFTIMVDSVHRDRSLARIERLSKKYPEWTLRA